MLFGKGLAQGSCPPATAGERSRVAKDSVAVAHLAHALSVAGLERGQFCKGISAVNPPRVARVHPRNRREAKIFIYILAV